MRRTETRVQVLRGSGSAEPLRAVRASTGSGRVWSYRPSAGAMHRRGQAPGGGFVDRRHQWRGPVYVFQAVISRESRPRVILRRLGGVRRSTGARRAPRCRDLLREGPRPRHAHSLRLRHPPAQRLRDRYLRAAPARGHPVARGRSRRARLSGQTDGRRGSADDGRGGGRVPAHPRAYARARESAAHRPLARGRPGHPLPHVGRQRAARRCR
jgi:hypothetical protein